MKARIEFFVSYARDDHDTANHFLKRLRQQLAPSKRYEYVLWYDRDILVGERWHDEIQQALEACQMGLLLMSPSFLESDYIARYELPCFLGGEAKPIIPVMLQTVNAQRHDLKGLEAHQLFRLDHSHAFADCTTEALRRRFVETLFEQIERRLDRLLAHR